MLLAQRVRMIRVHCPLVLLVIPACAGLDTEPLATFQADALTATLTDERSLGISPSERNVLLVELATANSGCPGLDPAPVAILDGEALPLLHHRTGGISEGPVRGDPYWQQQCGAATLIYALDRAGTHLVLDELIAVDFAHSLITRSLQLELPADGMIGPGDQLALQLSPDATGSAIVDIGPVDEIGVGYTDTVTFEAGRAVLAVPASLPAGRLRIAANAEHRDGEACTGAARCELVTHAQLDVLLEQRP